VLLVRGGFHAKLWARQAGGFVVTADLVAEIA